MTTFRTLSRRAIALLRLAPGREELSDLLSQADPTHSLEERVLWLERLVHWIKSSAINTHAFTEEGQLHSVRLRFIFHLLERNEKWKANVAATLRSLVLELETVDLFCHAGLTQEKGFFFEALDRTLHRFLPSPPQAEEASEFFTRVFTSRDDAAWIENLPEELIGRLVDLISFGVEDGSAGSAHFQRSMMDALVILASNVASTGSSYEIRRRLPGQTPTSSPFLRLNQRVGSVFQNFSVTGELGNAQIIVLESCLQEVERCRAAIQAVFDHLEKSGVSISLVYSLERQISSLKRVDVLIRLMTAQTALESHRLITDFFAALIREQLASQTLSGLVRTNMHLLSRKIVERSGATGEHYITRDKAEYFLMLRSAAGGGFVTVGTTLGKFLVSKMYAAPFFEGVFISINYAGSFLLMQFLSFTLATKQPSMTASSLAGKLKDVEHDWQIKEFVTEVSCLTRSQFAAALGNIGMAIPCAALLTFSVYWLTGHHILDVKTAEYILHSLHPLLSLTIPLAAFTGVVLWLSSVAAGWFENWIVYHQIPEAIASHRRLRLVLGDKKANRIAEWFGHNVAGIGGNVSLGFLLAFIPVGGKFFGLPLDVRHVTLSSVALTFASCTILVAGVSPTHLIFPCVGILIIGLMNFGVSFALALTVAIRAREVEATTVWRLAREIKNRFRKSPLEFFYPTQLSQGTPPLSEQALPKG